MLERFWDKVDITNSCWNWEALCNKDGYGRINSNGTMLLAHRYIYEILENHIPIGLELDHLCRNRKCVNPNHLDIVTKKENWSRGNSQSAKQSRQTHCKNGHEYSKHGIYLQNGHRRCIPCKKKYDRLRWSWR